MEVYVKHKGRSIDLRRIIKEEMGIKREGLKVTINILDASDWLAIVVKDRNDNYLANCAC